MEQINLKESDTLYILGDVIDRHPYGIKILRKIMKMPIILRLDLPYASDALGRFDEANMWLDKAIMEAPYLRDPYVEKALLQYNLKNWNEVETLCLQALKITFHAKSYINEVFSWNYTIYDLLSISYFYQNNFKLALFFSNLALEMEPNDKRLIKNNKLIKQAIANNS